MGGVLNSIPVAPENRSLTRNAARPHCAATESNSGWSSWRGGPQSVALMEWFASSMWKLFQTKLADLTLSFSDKVSSGAGKLSGLFKLARLSSWLTRRMSKPPALLGIESFAAASLVVCYFFLMIPQGEAPRELDNNEMNAYLFTYLSDHPYTQKNLISAFSNWKARLAGPMITGWSCDLV
jgi:hypothetical protein